MSEKAFPLQKYLYAALRRIWRWHPERRKALFHAMVKDKYKCAQCKELYGRKEIAVDHIQPVVGTDGPFAGWDAYIQRLFVPASGLQILCKGCHSAKTKEENRQRRITKQKKKAA